ncbi:MAG: S-layer homology domain-containing protein [Oscillospiraceae bacterium]|nr:S-layer homology domain-containing protein [Oscillospiraceae bacterium]
MKKRFVSLMLALVMLVGLFPLSASAGYTEKTFSDKCVQYIKSHEGFSSKVYSDGTGWYIGYGVACGRYDYPNGITEAQADALLRQKMKGFADEVNKFLKRHDLGVTQYEFDAMCSMTYNLGASWLADGNKLPTMIIKGIDKYSDEDVVSAFAAWCHVGSGVNEGLLKRRIAEAKMFLSGDYSGNADGWKWLVCSANEGKADRKINCYKTGTVYGYLPGATRSGYTFGGWQTAEGKLINANMIVSSDLYVEARWIKGENAVVPVPELSFPDVKKGAWYYDYIMTLAKEGIISGYTDGTFKPNAYVTWGQALKMVTIASGFTAKESEDGEHWAQAYLDFAVEKGYVKKGSVKDLNANITRNDIANLLAAYLELDLKNLPANPFADTSSASVLALYAQGIFEGSVDKETGKRYFKGKDNIKRSEISTALCRTIEYVDTVWVRISGYRVPINYDLKMQSYDRDKFFSSGGRIYYNDRTMDIRYGIDVSQFQYDIDWNRVAKDGVDFAIIRVGYRGYTKGGLMMDPYFEKNIKGALAAGIDVGIYFFSQAINEREALDEAEFVLDAIKGYDITYPVVFDWEPQHYAGSRTDSYDGDTVTDCAIAFMNRVARAGYTPMMYYNKTMAYLKLDIERLEDYETWLAQYSVPAPDYIYDFDMWQYGCTASVNGIKGEVDVNISFKDYSK